MIEAIKQMVEALEEFGNHDQACPQWPTYSEPEKYPKCNCGYDDAIQAGRQAIAKAEKQEPVAWVDSDWHYQLHKKGMVIAHKDKSDVLVGEPQPLYTHPQQWVGITDEEFEQMLTDAKFTRSDLLMIGACVEDICNMVEAKLRERNT